MRNYETVTEAINDLKIRGYTVDLNIAFDSKLCRDDNCLNPEKFIVLETYRFEGESNPSDEDIVLALTSIDKKEKGILTDAFGTYATKTILKKLLSK